MNDPTTIPRSSLGSRYRPRRYRMDGHETGVIADHHTDVASASAQTQRTATTVPAETAVAYVRQTIARGIIHHPKH
jgi:hypothetical protein